jgi:FkbH-like protein
MTSSPSEPSTTRNDFIAALEAGDKFAAMWFARVLLAEDPGLSQFSFIDRELKKVPRGKLGLKFLKVALLSSFSIEFIKKPLTVLCFVNGIEAEIYLSSFGQFQQEILNPGSGLYSFAPHVVILSVEGSDWLLEIYRGYLDGLTAGFDHVLSRFREEFLDLVQAFRDSSKAMLLVNNFVPPVWRQLGILDGHVSTGQAQLVHRVNELLASIGQQSQGVMIMDYAGLVTRFGALRWYDERMSHYAKAPIAMDMLPQLAGEYVKYFRGLTGQTKKCVVLDLDNTLWGGILGEDGLAGIQLGSVYPGSAYLAFQNEILTLHKRGVLLAIASKNNAADVDEVFAKHPSMVLKKEHFANLQIHWGLKSESLQQIARELNIGLEHVVFVDDNPVECAEVVRSLPMVTTVTLPKQPEHFVRALLEEGLFDALTFSDEDRRRGELYRQRSETELLRERSGSLEGFYRSLEMQVTFAPVDKSSLTRSAQLTQKTNQFNVTTIRFSESDLEERTKDPDWLVTTVKVRDRFGDNGIVGFIMARFDSNVLEIETFLLSCRVIGRNVETAMLAYLSQQALNRGVHLLHGLVIPTAKNVPARDLFSRHAFEKSIEKDSGETSWTLDLRKGSIAWPEWIKIIADVPDVPSPSNK